MTGFPPSGAPPAPPAGFILTAALGSGLAIAATGALSVVSGAPWLMAPFGATCVLAFGVPEAPLAQPRAILGGHLLTSAIGLLAVALLGTAWWATAVAVALALASMFLLRVLHAPAGANPILLAALAQGGTPAGWSFLLMPVLAGSLVIVLLAWAVGSLRHYQSRGSLPRYPRYWW